MKALDIILIIAVGSLSQLPCSADQSNFCITSPDRPPVWYNRSGDKLSEELRWSNSKQQLMLRVAYANVDSTVSAWRDQTLVDTFVLSFPTVRLDRSTSRLYFIDDHGREINIGHLESGLFGNRVVLDDNVELSAHRRNGVITAAIRSVNGPSR